MSVKITVFNIMPDVNDFDFKGVFNNYGQGWQKWQKNIALSTKHMDIAGIENAPPPPSPPQIKITR